MEGNAMRDDRPTWARRIRAERLARRWSQKDAIHAMRAHSKKELPGDEALLRKWRRWEAGETEPEDPAKPLIAKTFGTVTAAIFPAPARGEAALIDSAGMSTLELVSRVRMSDISPATIDALRITADRLCSEYPYTPSEQLLVEGRSWLGRMTGMLDSRMTLTQHKEMLSLTGTVALLLGCVEYDSGLRSDSEGTRRAALSLGQEAGDTHVMGWAQEMRAWYSLTQGNYRATIAAGQAGEAMAGRQSVSVQLIAQQAKAWARLGDRRQVEVALDRGREILESLPLPEDTDHHFVVDPDKFDFYAMDCYRILGEDQLAEMYAHEVIRTSTDPDGTRRKPMRAAEALVTLGVTAARAGEADEAARYGEEALTGERQSLPSLLMCSTELTQILSARYPDQLRVAEYLEHVHSISR